MQEWLGDPSDRKGHLLWRQRQTKARQVNSMWFFFILGCGSCWGTFATAGTTSTYSAAHCYTMSHQKRTRVPGRITGGRRKAACQG